MTLRHFQIFYTVCEKKSITAASEKLNMTQPAVSIAIKELESFYQVKLFERMNRGIHITEAGEQLLQYVGVVLSKFDESVDVLRNEEGFVKCRIGANVTFAESYLTDIMKKIEAEIKPIELSVFINNTAVIEQMLVDNEIDMAIVDEPLNYHNKKINSLRTEEMLVVCAKNSGLYECDGESVWLDSERDEVSLSVAELAKKRLLLREKGSANRRSVDMVFQNSGFVINPYVESTSSMTLLELAEKGLGYTILPEKIVRKDLESGKLIKINLTDASFVRHYYLIHHTNKYLTVPMKKVMQIICDN